MILDTIRLVPLLATGGYVATLTKIVRWVRDGWVAIGIALLLFGLLEGVLSLGVLIEDRLGQRQPSIPDWRVDADAYPDRSWVTKYYAEFRASDGVRWWPYVYWRRHPYRGEYINVDRTGLRHMSVSTATGADSSGSIKIFMFGGSALWGTGARDEFTIPSVLARELANHGIPAEVTNFGESGYVSTQEVIALLLRLQAGDIPDIVLFYDGVNDTYSAYQQHAAGLPQNEFKRVSEFNLPSDFSRLRAMALRSVTDSLATVQMLTSLLQRVGLPLGPRRQALTELAADHPAGAAGVAAVYFGNVELVKALGEHYGFKHRFYWQPTIFQKTSLTGYEQSENRKANDFASFFRDAYAAVRQRRQTGAADSAFRDLSLVFADMRQPVFLDWVHIGEAGNEAIARIMATDVVNLTSRHRVRHFSQ